eukprot:8032792-Pyramimonas_sp.AAC.1
MIFPWPLEASGAKTCQMALASKTPADVLRASWRPIEAKPNALDGPGTESQPARPLPSKWAMRPMERYWLSRQWVLLSSVTLTILLIFFANCSFAHLCLKAALAASPLTMSYLALVSPL